MRSVIDRHAPVRALHEPWAALQVEPFVVALPDDRPLATRARIEPADLRGCPTFVPARRVFTTSCPLALRDYRAAIGLAYTDLDNPAKRALPGVMQACLGAAWEK